MLIKKYICPECQEEFRSEVMTMAHFMTTHPDKIKRRI